MPGFYEVEDNDDYTQANALPAFPFTASEVSGSLGTAANYFAYDGDTADWFSFTTTESGFLHLSGAMVPQAGALPAVLALYRNLGGGNLEPGFTRTYLGEIASSTYLSEAGEYFLALTGDNYAGNYGLGLSFSPAALYETEPNDTAATADPLPDLPVPWGPVFGSVGDNPAPEADDGEVVYDGSSEDWYSFTLAAPGPVQLELYPLFGFVDFELYDAAGAVLLDGLVGENAPERRLTLLPAAGTYTVRVMLQPGSTHANYFLSILAAGSIGWYSTPIVDSADTQGHYSLAVVNGRPAVAYCDSTDGGPLRYARAADAWGIDWEAPLTIADDQADGQYCSLAVINGKPAVSYFSDSGWAMAGMDYLGYVAAQDADGALWDTPLTVDGGDNHLDMGLGTSLCEVNGQPAIAYYNVAMPLTLYYIRAQNAAGTIWGTRQLVATSTTSPTPLNFEAHLIMVGDRPAVAFSRDDLALNYLRADDPTGAAWSGTPAELNHGDRVWGFSLVMISGCPTVAFFGEDTALGYGGILRYVKSTDGLGATWPAPVDVVTQSSEAGPPGLVETSFLPSLAYCSSAQGVARYQMAYTPAGAAWFSPETAGGWQPASVIETPAPALIELSGHPAMVYWDAATGRLMFAVKL